MPERSGRAAARIRPARAGEAAEISALVLRSKAHWGYDAAFLQACRDELAVTAQRIAAQPVFVLEVGGELLGVHALCPAGPRVAELDLLFVAPQAIGRGYGRRLLQHAQRTAAGLGFTALLIQGDPHAESFYVACGARRIGSRASASIAGRELPLFRIDLPRD